MKRISATLLQIGLYLILGSLQASFDDCRDSGTVYFETTHFTVSPVFLINPEITGDAEGSISQYPIIKAQDTVTYDSIGFVIRPSVAGGVEVGVKCMILSHALASEPLLTYDELTSFSVMTLMDYNDEFRANDDMTNNFDQRPSLWEFNNDAFRGKQIDGSPFLLRLKNPPADTVGLNLVFTLEVEDKKLTIPIDPVIVVP